jgi:hypothetical protein
MINQNSNINNNKVLNSNISKNNNNKKNSTYKEIIDKYKIGILKDLERKTLIIQKMFRGKLLRKKFEKKLENINIKVPNKNMIQIHKISQNDNEIANENYHQTKEKEINIEDYNSPDTKVENKFKFNNIPLGNSLLYKNQPKPKEEEKEIYIDNNDKNQGLNNINNPNNKFSNTNMLLESGIDIKNIPIYDSIEEVAEWQGGNDWNNIQGEGLGNKLIKLDNTKNVEKVNNNIDDEDMLEFGSLERKETYRPYTPPIEELVQVNPNRMKGDSNMKMSLDKKSTLKSNKTLKNYENLVYIEEKGLLYDPVTNKYYDIKAK